MSRLRIPRSLLLALAIFSSAVPANAQSRQPPTAPPTGGIYVTTLPIGADIWCDGVYVGRSPAFVDALMPGRHAITATKTGWESHEVDVTVNSGQTEASSVALQRLPGARVSMPGKIEFFALKSLRAVSIDGAPATLSPGGIVTVSAGSHSIVARTDGGVMMRQVTVYPEMTTSLILRNSDGGTPNPHMAVVAPASDFLPATAYEFDTKSVYIKYHHHEVSAHIGVSTIRFDGEAVSYDAAPTFIDGKLYLPLELLKLLRDGSKAK